VKLDGLGRQRQKAGKAGNTTDPVCNDDLRSERMFREGHRIKTGKKARPGRAARSLGSVGGRQSRAAARVWFVWCGAVG
jgi:hypothetical protein